MSELTDPTASQEAGELASVRAADVPDLPPPSFFKRTLSASARPLLVTALAAAVWWVVWLSFGRSPIRTHLAEQVVLPVAIVALICIVGARHELHWSRPMRHMSKLLPEIRAGAAPIEELSELKRRGIGPLVEQVQELLRDLKRQKLEVSILNDEIRQRVANRTDALERIVGSLRAQATRDALTTLLNRRMFDVALPKLIETCRAQGTDLCVLMMDVDHFKMLNDTLGHAAGDELLRNIGQIIRSTHRPRDMAFRLGGDEFVVLMPGGDEESAQGLSNRLISLVDGLAKTLKLTTRPRLSIGISRMLLLPASDDASRTAEALVGDADRKLYEVKAQRKAHRPVTTSAA